MFYVPKGFSRCVTAFRLLSLNGLLSAYSATRWMLFEPAPTLGLQGRQNNL